jgi:hypothetical protein
MTTKLYNTRDSATSVLRKLGIKPRDYDLFIRKVDGKFECSVEAAAAHLASLLLPSTQAPKQAQDDCDKPVATRPMGVGQLARDLILAGRTNQEIWVALKQRFNLDDSKKHYPSWYRCQLKRTQGISV